MKIKDFFKIIFVALFVANIVACSDDEKIDDEFDIPPLTVDNTIQFKVNTDGTRTVKINARGRFAVDWGDGTLEKRNNLDGDGIVRTYKSSGDFQVKIWSDELTFLNVSGLLTPMSELQVGRCPLMRDLVLNSFHRTESLDLTNCPNVETLNIGNYPDLESLNVSKCTQLNQLQCYTNPKLSSLDLSNNKELDELSLRDTDIKELSLKANTDLMRLDLTRNTKLSSIDWGAKQSLYFVQLYNSALTSFDATLFPDLQFFYAAGNKFDSLDFSTNKKLYYLECFMNELESLIISEECNIIKLYCHANKLGVDQLDALFKRLPISRVTATKSSPPPPPQPNEIMFYDNPGAGDCEVQIIKDKGWKIIEG